VSATVRASSADGIRVIARAGQILRALGAERGGLSLSDIAGRVALPRSTAHRIITALEAEGLIASAWPNGHYSLGPELVRLSRGHHGEVLTELRPMLRQLSARVDETVALSILFRDRVCFVDQVAAAHPLSALSVVGWNFPAHCNAHGKALLATYRDDVLRRLLPAKLEAETPHTITDRDLLIKQLATVRQDGYATAREEQTLGISAVAAVVGDEFGPAAAVSIPVPTQRFIGNEQSIIDSLLAAVKQMSELLGAPRS
jgi:DNA-binding IclR family transcriptional regulator